MLLAGSSVHTYLINRLCWTLILVLTRGLLRERFITLVLSSCGS